MSPVEIMASNVEDWLLVEEVVEKYGLPETSLRYWRKNRTGPVAFRVGRRLRYPPAGVEEWMRNQAARDRIAQSTKS